VTTARTPCVIQGAGNHEGRSKTVGEERKIKATVAATTWDAPRAQSPTRRSSHTYKQGTDIDQYFLCNFIPMTQDGARGSRVAPSIALEGAGRVGAQVRNNNKLQQPDSPLP
jgi:hypothetical protein